jgi:hypothetical protein
MSCRIFEKIRAELAWVNETPDPNKCGCRNVRCCEETGHKPGSCSGTVATKFRTFRWEYYCQAESVMLLAVVLYFEVLALVVILAAMVFDLRVRR